MLNCVYHPVNSMRVVDNKERERLLASGFWFDSPYEAKKSREKVEKQIMDEPKAAPVKAKAKAKLEEKYDEKSNHV